MPLNANRTSDDFTFKHTGQVDEYGASVGDIAVVQGNFDSRAIDNMNDINNIKTILKCTTADDSGAHNIGSETIPGITGNTVWDQIADLLAIAQAAQAGTIIDGSVTIAKLSFDPATQAELDTVSANLTTHASEASHVGGLIYLYKNLGGTL